jgi:hypothetical protein
MPEPLIPYQTQAQGLHHDEKFHDIGVLSKRRKPMGDLGWKDVTLIPVEAVVMTIFG